LVAEQINFQIWSQKRTYKRWVSNSWNLPEIYQIHNLFHKKQSCTNITTLEYWSQEKLLEQGIPTVTQQSDALSMVRCNLVTHGSTFGLLIFDEFVWLCMCVRRYTLLLWVDVASCDYFFPGCFFVKCDAFCLTSGITWKPVHIQYIKQLHSVYSWIYFIYLFYFCNVQTQFEHNAHIII